MPEPLCEPAPEELGTEFQSAEITGSAASAKGTARARRVLRAAWTGVYAVCAVAAVFWLPLHVPMRPSASISYLLGYNNHTALMALLIALATGSFFVPGLDFATAPVSGARVPRRTLLRVLLATTLLAGAMTWVAHGTWGMDESTYLTGRIQLLLAGQRPYQDFEFIYGPLLLYAPAWASEALHLGIGPAYFLVWWLEWLAGTLLLAFLVNSLGIPRERVRIVFLLFWSAFLSSLINTGETYTPLRELAAPASMVLVHRATAFRHRWLVFVLAVGCAAALFCISPEFALAFMTAASVYMVLYPMRRGRLGLDRLHLGGLACTVLCFAGLLRLALRLHEFDSARQFGSGGSDIPLLLTPTTLFVLAGLLIACSFAATALKQRRIHDARFALVLLGVVLLPGMMGRADPSHLVLYGMGMLMVAMALLARGSRKSWEQVTFLFVLLITLPLIGQKLLIDFLPFFDAGGRVLYPHGVAQPGSAGERVRAAVEARWGEQAALRFMREMQIAAPDPHAAYPKASPVLMAPFGYNVRGREKQVRSDVVLGYFDGTVDLMSPVQVRRKIDELAAHPERDLLLPEDFSVERGCATDLRWATGLLRLNFGYTYLTTPRHTPHMLDPLCAYIEIHYVRIGAPRDASSMYGLWQRRPGTTPAAESEK